MANPDDDLKQELLESDDEFRRLYEQHQECERRLDRLHLEHAVSEEDEAEAKSIKRQKLWLKDRMETILRSEREARASV